MVAREEPTNLEGFLLDKDPQAQYYRDPTVMAAVDDLCCIVCGKIGGHVILAACQHMGGFVVHSARRCLRHAPQHKMVTYHRADIGVWAHQHQYRHRNAWPTPDNPNIGCKHCGIYPAKRTKREKKVVTNMAVTETSKAIEVGFWAKLAERAKDEGGQSSIRIGARQFLKTAKAPILGVLQRRGVNTKSLATFLDTPLGEGCFGLGLGVMVPYIPGIGGKALSSVLASELRIAGMSTLGSEFADVLLDPLREAMLAAFAGDLGGDEKK